MPETSSQFHFPKDIKLKSSPLAEAWLDIRWQLQPVNPPHIMKDDAFAFALGTFYNSIRDRFPYRENTDVSQVPPEMLPHVVRHRFRPNEGGWPLLQIGPGVATVNFTSPYTWTDFQELAMYLRSNLCNAYGENELKVETITLRYRNTRRFDFASENLLGFLREQLNTNFVLPTHIPGGVSSSDRPTSANLILTFDLLEPKGTGTLQFATARRNTDASKADENAQDRLLLWQLDVASGGTDAPSLADEEKFTGWLDAAHATVHEWFFSIIEGPLLEEYQAGGE